MKNRFFISLVVFLILGSSLQSAEPLKWKISSSKAGVQTGKTLDLFAAGETGGWSSSSFPVVPNSLYRFKVGVEFLTDGPKGSLPMGLGGLSRDYTISTDFGKTFKEFSHVLFTSSEMNRASFVLRHWYATGSFRFHQPELIPVDPVYTLIESKGSSDPQYLPLGNNESIINGQYRFNGFGRVEDGNFSRPLVSSTASFNTNRWCLYKNQSVVYRFCLQPIRLTSRSSADPNASANGNPINPEAAAALPFSGGSVEINVGYYIGGRCIVEGSIDGKSWKELGSNSQKGSICCKIDSALFGQKKDLSDLWIRMSVQNDEKGKTTLQIDSMKVLLDLKDKNYAGQGSTCFAEKKSKDLQTEKTFKTGPYFIDPEMNFVYFVQNQSKKPLSWAPVFSVRSPDKAQSVQQLPVVKTMIPSESTAIVRQKVPSDLTEYELSADLDTSLAVSFKFPAILLSNCAKGIPDLKGKSGSTSVFWCEPENKILKRTKAARSMPKETIKIAAPKNDFESFQIVLRRDANTKDLVGLKGKASDLIDEKGNRISSSKIQLRYAYYHFVERTTDSEGLVADWPDALVPMKKGSDGYGSPLNIQAGCNFPIWITVSIDESVQSGIYRGSVSLNDSKGELALEIPYQLEVWDFALPKINRLETAFGLSAGTIVQYHNCKTKEDQRAVYELYLKNFGEHRISPYDPAPFDSYSVKWNTTANPPAADLDLSHYIPEMKRVFDKYHFTNFRLHLHGMGGGTFEKRYPPQIGKFDESTKEYKLLFSDYLNKLQTELEKAGLLKGAYAYWFDEPDEKDYEFVADGFARLKKYGPKISRMLTEEPGSKLCDILDQKGTSLDIWCPVSSNFSSSEAEKRMEKKERFWWYVCTGPKAPYCTLFIDHPGTEMRVWLWQTYKRKIGGILVWASNYWTSRSAFPKSPQNPYLDPMGYVSSSAINTKAYWGNGDGRFVYPPLAAAVPGLNNGKPILEEPVCSIRWEILREGIEDYEMLTILSDLIKKNEKRLTPDQKSKIEALFQFDSITKSMISFTKVPGPIYQKRAAIAQMIIELQK
ncbi:MAG: DUF4091 domain-containing protein [Planctomycetia bacterium]|nr:DUF4091 domain-containing protein [Planctomycetia bacterium]